MAANDDFIAELAKRYGASGESSDIARLNEYEQGIAAGTTTPEQLAAHKKALETQYAQRGSNVPNQSGGAAPQAPAATVQTPAQSWNAAPAAAPVDQFPAWYRDLMTQQVQQQQAQQAATTQKADALYGQLNDRATQGLQINASDPIIKGQVDAYGAAGERSRRNYLSDVAEQGGPYQNMRGEQRMTAEKLGQGTSAFQAELLGRELGARRDEIANALQTQGAILSADQQRNLTQQLAQMDQAIKEAGVGLQGQGLAQQGALGFAGLDLQRQLGMGGLDLQRTLGLGGLGLQARGQDLSQDQFLRELALRQWDLGDQSDFRWANL